MTDETQHEARSESELARGMLGARQMSSGRLGGLRGFEELPSRHGAEGERPDGGAVNSLGADRRHSRGAGGRLVRLDLECGRTSRTCQFTFAN